MISADATTPTCESLEEFFVSLIKNGKKEEFESFLAGNNMYIGGSEIIITESIKVPEDLDTIKRAGTDGKVDTLYSKQEHPDFANKQALR